MISLVSFNDGDDSHKNKQEGIHHYTYLNYIRTPSPSPPPPPPPPQSTGIHQLTNRNSNSTQASNCILWACLQQLPLLLLRLVSHHQFDASLTPPSLPFAHGGCRSFVERCSLASFGNTYPILVSNLRPWKRGPSAGLVAAYQTRLTDTSTMSTRPALRLLHTLLP